MISNLSARIAAGLGRASIIPQDECDLYAYGFYIMLSKVMFFLITTLFGLIFGVCVESIVFYVLFSVLRAYAGGIHASTETKCFLFTSAAMFLCVFGIFCIKKFEIEMPNIVLFAASLVPTVVFSPLDTEEKPLSKSEKKKYKKITVAVSVVYASAAIVCILLKKPNFFYSIEFAVVLETVLLLSGKIKKAVKSKR